MARYGTVLGQNGRQCGESSVGGGLAAGDVSRNWGGRLTIMGRAPSISAAVHLWQYSQEHPKRAPLDFETMVFLFETPHMHMWGDSRRKTCGNESMAFPAQPSTAGLPEASQNSASFVQFALR